MFAYWIKKVVNETINSFIEIGKNRVYINAYVNFVRGKLNNSNYGDDLNYFLLKEITKTNIYFYNSSLIAKILRKKNFVCIGSVLNWIVNDRSIVWGAGAIDNNAKISAKPLKVLAVRGPLSRDYLLKQNIECPEVYGDPALLLPLFYKPVIKKKYTLGIIPHIVDLNNILVKEISDEIDFCVINFKEYEDWRSVIDQICECEYIISSSLHGLIISDAYDIPNMWIQFSDNIVGGTFKFQDYFAAVGRDHLTPRLIVETINRKIIDEIRDSWTKIQYDRGQLLNCCPFAKFD